MSSETEAVTVMFLVKVGSRYEAPDESGLAHFVEHTLFKGTVSRPSSKDIGMEIESLGGSSNAFTSYDYTGYYIKAPAKNFKQTFTVLSDMFMNSTFEPKELERERGVIIEEIKMYEDRPPAKVSQIWTRNFFQNNTLGLDIAGTIDSVRHMKREQFLQFLKKHYYAENVLVVIAGNVKQQEVEEMVNGICLAIPGKGDQPASTYEPFSFEQNPARQREIVVNKDVEQAHLMLGGLALARNHELRFAQQVANGILGAGFGSRLFQVIRDDLGLAYYVYSRITGFDDTGVFQIGMGVDATRVEEAISATKTELSRMVKGEFSEAELERSKNFIIGNVVTELETSEEIASFYGMQELLERDQLTIEETKRRIESVDRESVLQIFNQLYREDNYFLARLMR